MNDNRKTLEIGSNGNGRTASPDDEELRKLRILLQRAVRTEEAPESLRERIRKLIREN